MDVPTMVISPTRVIQVTNIAPQATRDQMHQLFTSLGFTIEDLRLYPMVREAHVALTSRIAFIKFEQPEAVGVCQHLNNTVFIDRAIIISPYDNGSVPDETFGLQIAASNSNNGNSLNGGRPVAKMPPDVVNRLEGLAPHAYIMTYDPKLEAQPHLPAYPPLPANTLNEKVEEIRRTVCVINLDQTVSAQQCMEMFSEAGEVKYFRYCTRENDPVKYALIEFTDQSSVIPALLMNDKQLGMSRIKVTHSVQAIAKPQTKSNEAVQKEIEEALSKVKEAQNLVSAAVDPLMGMLGAPTSARVSMTKSRSRSKSRKRSRSRSRGRSSYNNRRSRSRERRSSRRSRTRSRERKKRSRSRDRKRSRSRDRKKRHRSRSPNHRRHRDRKKEEEIGVDGKKNGENGSSKAEKKRSRSKSRERKRSRSKERKRKSRSRSRDRSRRKRSRSKEKKKHRSRSRERHRDKDKKSSKHLSSSVTTSSSKKEIDEVKPEGKVSRDYDQEEAGFEQPSKKEIAPSTPVREKVKEVVVDGKNLETEDMEISNSP